MKTVFAALLATTMMTGAAFATSGGSDNSAVAYGGNGGTGVGKGGDARSSAAAYSGASAGAAAIQGQNQSLRSSMSTKQLNEQSLSSANESSSDNSGGNSSNDNSSHVSPGSVISYTYVPEPLPQGSLSNDAAITSRQFHFVDPLFGMGWQSVVTLPDGAKKWVALSAVALGANPDGTVSGGGTVNMVAARAVICSEKPELGEQLAAATTAFTPCE